MRWRPFSSGCRSDRDSPGSFGVSTPRLFAANEHRFVYGQEPHTKSKKYFPLELRAKTIETSGQTQNAWGTGKTTAEMQTVSIFLIAGWDLVGETTNGTDDIWWILEGQDYPRLWWESTEQ